MIFPHYYAHFEVLAKICWWSGLYAITRKVTFYLRHTKWLVYICLILIIVVLFPSFYYYPWRSVIRGDPITNGFFFHRSLERHSEYRKLARSINSQLPENSTVLMPEIGILGFYLDRAYVIDACGLVSPEAVQYLPVPPHLRPGPGVGVIPPQLVRDHQPDVIIFLEIFGRKGVLEDDWFWQNYTSVIAENDRWLPWGSKAFYVFVRNDFRPGLRLEVNHSTKY
jgi:hypothetical protein